MISKEKLIFKDIYNRDLDKLNELAKKINYDDLIFVVEKPGGKTNFSTKKDPISFLDDIRKKRITMEGATDLQKDFNVYLRNRRKGNKTPEEKITSANINRLFNGRNDAIKFMVQRFLNLKD